MLRIALSVILLTASGAHAQRVVAVPAKMKVPGYVARIGLAGSAITPGLTGALPASGNLPRILTINQHVNLGLPNSILPTSAEIAVQAAKAETPLKALPDSMKAFSGETTPLTRDDVEKLSPGLKPAGRKLLSVREESTKVRSQDSSRSDAVEFFDNDRPREGIVNPMRSAHTGVHRFVDELEAPGNILHQKGIRATVTVYGSARTLPPLVARRRLRKVLKRVGLFPTAPEDRQLLAEARELVRQSHYYAEARNFGDLVARHGGGQVAVVSGGGPGIMEAANRGAYESGGPSVGFNILLKFEQGPNPYVTPGLAFEFENFETRKLALRGGSLLENMGGAHIYFPGGFGTLDELFETLTLMQTHKIKRGPIVLFGAKDYWDEIVNFKALLKKGMISKEDLDLFRYADTAEDAWSKIAPDLMRPFAEEPVEAI